MKKILIKLIRLYQSLPFKSHYNCKFYPTCSNYCILAIEKYGIRKGIILGIRRLLKCHPFHNGGYDPVK